MTLKDPVIVNDLFLKKPERIEALAVVLLVSLLIWNLIELTLRHHIKQTNEELPGWNKGKTKRPTSFMMSTYFKHVSIIQGDDWRLLGSVLNQNQLAYLEALGLPQEVFTTPDILPTPAILQPPLGP